MHFITAFFPESQSDEQHGKDISSELIDGAEQHETPKDEVTNIGESPEEDGEGPETDSKQPGYYEVDETTGATDKLENGETDDTNPPPYEESVDDVSQDLPEDDATSDDKTDEQTTNSILKDFDYSKAQKVRYEDVSPSPTRKSPKTTPKKAAVEFKEPPPKVPSKRSVPRITQKLVQPGKKRIGKREPPKEEVEQEEETGVKQTKHVETPWWELFYDYTQNATVHGIKYITEKDTYSFRK
jgi:hypothetical protein